MILFVCDVKKPFGSIVDDNDGMVDDDGKVGGRFEVFALGFFCCC